MASSDDAGTKAAATFAASAVAKLARVLHDRGVIDDYLIGELTAVAQASAAENGEHHEAVQAMEVVQAKFGLPSPAARAREAFALGLIAGLLDFVPLIGPIVAAVPTLLLALSISPTTALWTGGLYLVVQQIEGNILSPLVQQRAVDLPPALLLFALLGFGSLFGAPGVILAAPLTVVVYVMVKRLYVREALGTPTNVPGEHG